MTQVVNPEHEKLTSTLEKPVVTPENLEKSPKPGVESESEKINLEPVLHRDVRGQLIGELACGGGDVVVIPLIVETFIGKQSNEMMEAGRAVAEGASNHLKEGDTEGAQELMEKQIEAQRIKSDGTVTLSEAIREVPNVYAIEPGGFDPNKMGNKMNFSSDMMFGINPVEADHMLDLLQHPKSGVGELEATFTLKKNSPLDKEKEGFEVKYTDEEGKEREITFLYLNMKGAENATEKQVEGDPVADSAKKTETAIVADATPEAQKKSKEETVVAEETKEIEPVAQLDQIEPETDANVNSGEREERNPEDTGDTVAASAENATTAEILDTRDNNKVTSNVININRKPITQPVPPQVVSEQPQDLSKAA